MLFAANIIAQNKVIDSLFLAYKTIAPDSSKVKLINNLAFEYHRVNIDSTVYYGNLALQQAKQIGFIKGESRALNILAMAASIKGDYVSALNFNTRSYELASTLKNTLLISQSSNGLSRNYDRLNNAELSIRYSKIALEANKQMNDTLKIGYALTNLSQFHYDEGNYPKSSEYHNEVLKLANILNDCRLSAVAYQLLGKLQYAKNDLNASIENFNLSLEHADKCENKSSAGVTYFWISSVHLKKKDFKTAKKYIDRSNKLLDEIGHRDYYLKNYMIESDILTGLGKKDAAIGTLKEGLSKARKSKHIKYEVELLNKVSTFYKNNGEIRTAYAYLEESKIGQDSINNLNKAVSILELERKYNFEKKEVEVQLLQEQKSRDTQTIKSTKYLFLASSLFATLIGSIAFFTFLSLRRNANYSKILESEVGERTKELQKSNRLLQQSNEELERFAYISSHDLKEPLKNISSFTKLIKKESIESNNKKINDYASILENCSNQLNTMVTDILDYSLVKSDMKIQNVDLNHIMEQLNSDLDKTLKINNARIVTPTLPSIRTDKSSIYRIFKNLIENGVKYNKSSQPTITIRVEESSSAVKLIFEDNGIGIDTKHHEEIFMMFKRLHNKDSYAGSGIGLSTVKAIVERLKGTINIISSPNNGSKFVITLPQLN